MSKEILFYTDLQIGKNLAETVKDQIKSIGIPITSVSLRGPSDMGRNIIYHGMRSHSTLYDQILVGLRACKADYVFFCEHDVLYTPSHFDFDPPRDDVYYYNNNVYKYRLSDDKIVGYDCSWLSQLCANRELLIKHYEKRFEMIESGKRAYGYEPGTGQSRKIDKFKFERFESEHPNIDVRHGMNWTGVARMDPKEFRNKKTCRNFKEIKIDEVPFWSKKKLLSLK